MLSLRSHVTKRQEPVHRLNCPSTHLKLHWFPCCRGKELFPTKFIEFLTSKPGEDEDKKKKALIAELQSVNDHLEKSGKPYFGGDDVCATDLSMAPKIKHIKIGADEVKVIFDCCLGQNSHVKRSFLCELVMFSVCLSKLHLACKCAACITLHVVIHLDVYHNFEFHCKICKCPARGMQMCSVMLLSLHFPRKILHVMSALLSQLACKQQTSMLQCLQATACCADCSSGMLSALQVMHQLLPVTKNAPGHELLIPVHRVWVVLKALCFAGMASTL